MTSRSISRVLGGLARRGTKCAEALVCAPFASVLAGRRSRSGGNKVGRVTPRLQFYCEGTLGRKSSHHRIAGRPSSKILRARGVLEVDQGVTPCVSTGSRSIASSMWTLSGTIWTDGSSADSPKSYSPRLTDHRQEIRSSSPACVRPWARLDPQKAAAGCMFSAQDPPWNARSTTISQMAALSSATRSFETRHFGTT